MSGRRVEFTEVDDFVAQRNAEALSDCGPASLDQRPDIPGGRSAVVDDEVGMRRRNASAARRSTLQAGAVDERARRPGNAARHAIAASLVRILKNAAGAVTLEWLRPLAVSKRFFCRRSQRVRIAAPDTKDGPDDGP